MTELRQEEIAETVTTMNKIIKFFRKAKTVVKNIVTGMGYLLICFISGYCYTGIILQLVEIVFFKEPITMNDFAIFVAEMFWLIYKKLYFKEL